MLSEQKSFQSEQESFQSDQESFQSEQSFQSEVVLSLFCSDVTWGLCHYCESRTSTSLDLVEQ